MPPSIIAAVIVTYQRNLELGRLLTSLEASSVQPRLIIVVDHGACSSTRVLLARFDVDTHYVAAPENPGPGGGWKTGMESALRRLPEITHFLILDDDVVVPPDAVERLLSASANAAIICPMLLDSDEKVWAFPEPTEPALRAIIRKVKTPEECMQALGISPLPFLWCTGACVLVRRDAVDAVGYHRTDFWMLGEDLEYSMRLVGFGGGLYLPNLFVSHLPPVAEDSAQAEIDHRRKFNSLLQNLAYLSFHHPNSAHLKWYLAGNARRYFRTFGWNSTSFFNIAKAYGRGALFGQPSGSKRNLFLKCHPPKTKQFL